MSAEPRIKPGDRVKRALDYGGHIPLGTVEREHETRDGWLWVRWDRPRFADALLQMEYCADLELAGPADERPKGDS